MAALNPDCRRVTVPLGERTYPILLGFGLEQDAEAVVALAERVRGRSCVIVTDANVGPRYAPSAEALLRQHGATRVAVLAMPAGESSKTLATLSGLYTAAVAAGLDRKSLVVALGGGVIGDLAGFCAATYMRGIGLVQFPTSLLALVDSSVGGKVGVDLPEGKNLVGAFHQPRLVWGDLARLASLPDREWQCGLAEIIKYGVILDADLFARLEPYTLPSFRADLPALLAVVARCCELKAEVVAADETETGRRAILNYGHTFGHALEALGGFCLLNHGEAVALGMGMAADLAVKLGRLDAAVAVRQDALCRQFGLPTRLDGAGFAPDAVLAAMARDKKTVGGTLNLILPSRIGAADLVTVPERELLLSIIGGRLGKS